MGAAAQASLDKVSTEERKCQARAGKRTWRQKEKTWRPALMRIGSLGRDFSAAGAAVQIDGGNRPAVRTEPENTQNVEN
jgi:hypothetical protein